MHAFTKGNKSPPKKPFAIEDGKPRTNGVHSLNETKEDVNATSVRGPREVSSKSVRVPSDKKLKSIFGENY